MVYMLHYAGNNIEAISSTTVTDYMDKLSWGSAIGYLHLAALAYFVLGEKLYLGSIIGAVIVIIGLYLLLWGNETEQEVDSKTEEQSCSTCDEEKCHNTNTESHSSLKASTRAVVMP
ncbi:hypothetical protein ACOSQ3_006984 [Xanthoceras sorbifolium]